MDGSARTLEALTPERLHARYATKIGRHIRRVMGADTEREDLVHEVLLTMFRNIETLRNPNALDAWVSQVTANTLKYVMRQRRVRRHVSWETLSEPAAVSVHMSVEARQLASRALRVLDRLPVRDRALLMTYWFTPATAEVIAGEMRCSVMTVRRYLFRARSRFEKLARADPALAGCLAEARIRSRRSC